MTWLRNNNASVLYSHRSALDIIISGSVADEVGHHQSHCRPGDQRCIDAHANTHVTLDTGNTLLRKIREGLADSGSMS